MTENSHKPIKFKFYKPKVVRNTLIATSVLLVFALLGGSLYTWYLDRQANHTITSMPSSTNNSDAIQPIQPVQPAANEPEGVSIVMLTSPVKRGSDVSMTVNTNAQSNCTILVTYNKVVANAPTLSPITADSYGSASWTWHIGNTVPIGIWPIKVTCTYHKSIGVATSTLQVTN